MMGEDFRLRIVRHLPENRSNSVALLILMRMMRPVIQLNDCNDIERLPIAAEVSVEYGTVAL
jgi:hypothetical protein